MIAVPQVKPPYTTRELLTLACGVDHQLHTMVGCERRKASWQVRCSCKATGSLTDSQFTSEEAQAVKRVLDRLADATTVQKAELAG